MSTSPAVRPLVLVALCALAAAPTPEKSPDSSKLPAHAAPEQQLLPYLSQVVTWFRQQTAQAQLASEVDELAYVDSTRQTARDVAAQAFLHAHAEAAALAAQPGTSGKIGSDQSAQLEQHAGEAQAAVLAAKRAVEQLESRLASTHGRARVTLEDQISEAKSELELAEARQQTLKTFTDFLSQASASSTSAAGLTGQINELQRTIPEASAPTAAAPQARTTADAKPAPSGIFGLSTELIANGRKLRQLTASVTSTTRLRAEVESLRAPLMADLRATLSKGEELSAAPETIDAAVLEQRRRDIDALTARFRRLSASVLPLDKQAVLLDTHKSTLAEWHAAVDSRYDQNFRALLLRLVLLAAAIIAVLVASEAWRRATLRYVHDTRRRQQSLVVRRIVVALAVLLIFAFSLVSELGSLATFAGFLTAGLAVALQNIILSVAAYFFLIGKYGIRVGDRVQISGVMGDVMDIGLVRLHLIELRDGLATGRVVVFSNSVFFQPTASFFKQIPGSNFGWHQVTLTLSQGADYRLAEDRLMKAVDGVYSTYRQRIVQQHRAMSEDLSISVPEPKPQSRLVLHEGGVQISIRFPVPLDEAARVDDGVTRALLDEVERKPALNLSMQGAPSIQTLPDAPVQ